MNYRRSDQVDTLLRSELAALLPRYFHEARYGLITVVRVSTTRNFDSARAYISCLKNQHSFLEDAAGKIYKIQKELDKKLVMKRVPKLIFELDRATALTDRIDHIIDELQLPADDTAEKAS